MAISGGVVAVLRRKRRRVSKNSNEIAGGRARIVRHDGLNKSTMNGSTQGGTGSNERRGGPPQTLFGDLLYTDTTTNDLSWIFYLTLGSAYDPLIGCPVMFTCHFRPKGCLSFAKVRDQWF